MLYRNIGEKIKYMTFVVGILFCIFGGVAGVLLLAQKMYILALICTLAGALGFFSSWIFYGFAELIENVSALREQKEPKLTEQTLTDDLPEL